MTPDQLPGFIGAKDLARLLGLTVTRVSALAKDGVIPKDSRGVYPLPAAVASYVAWVKDHPDGRPHAPKNLNAEKVRLTAAQAELAEAKAAQVRGDLLDARAVHVRWVETITAIRAALLAVPPRIAAQAGLDRSVAALLDAEVRAALDQIASAGEDAVRAHQDALGDEVEALLA